MVSLEKVPLNQALKERHAGEVPEETPRLLILLQTPLCVVPQELVVVEKFCRICLVVRYPDCLVASFQPICLLNALLKEL